MSLLTTLQVREIAFEWDSTKRVYRASEISIFDEPDREDFQYSNKTLGHVTDGVWLFFQISSEYFQRLSPSGASGNDYIDILNALDDGAKTVTMYPIHDVDNSVSYDVKPTQSQRSLLQTGRPRKGLFRPQIELEVRAVSQVSQLPAWLRMTRER